VYAAANGWVEVVGWMKGATTVYGSAGTASTNPLVPTSFNVDTVSIRPIIFLNYNNGNGHWLHDYFRIQELDEDQANRVYAALTGGGDLHDGVGQADGVAVRPLVRGYVDGVCEGGLISGSSWADGATVVLPQTFDAPPIILLEGGLEDERRSSFWTFGYDPHKGIYRDVKAINVTPSTFIPRARFVQTGDLTFTNRTSNFAGTLLDVLGETDVAVLSNAPAYDDNYKVSYSVTLEVVGSPAGPYQVEDYWDHASITIAIDTSADGGSSWNERTRNTHSMTLNNYQISTFTMNIDILVSGLSSSAPADQIRLRVVDQTAGFGQANATGFGVAYQTATGITSYASKTPTSATDATDRMFYRAMAK
jgi:hypothetical protein